MNPPLALALSVACAAGALGVMRLRPNGAKEGSLLVPLSIVLLVVLAAIRADPLVIAAWFHSGPPLSSGNYAWVVISVPLIAGLIAMGIGKHGSTQGHPLPWLGASIIAAFVAWSEKLRLLDAQLLLLAALACVWIHTARHEAVAPAPAYSRSRLVRALLGLLAVALAGAGGWFAGPLLTDAPWRSAALCLFIVFAVAALLPTSLELHHATGWIQLLSVTMGLGSLALVHVFAAYILAIRVDAAASWDDPARLVAAAADSARSSPYLGGMLGIAPEAAILAVATGAFVIARRGELEPRGGRLIFLCLAGMLIGVRFLRA